jgi:hypothetical protein
MHAPSYPAFIREADVSNLYPVTACYDKSYCLPYSQIQMSN